MTGFIVFAAGFILFKAAILYLLAKQPRNRGSEHGQSGPGSQTSY